MNVPQPIITVIGLGPGDPSLLTIASSEVLATADKVWIRTRRHPTVELLNLNNKIETFDHIYNRMDKVEDVYQAIAESIVEEVLAHPELRQVYAVPGSPSTGERSVILIRQLCNEKNIPLRALPGISSVEAALLELGIDPLTPGIQILDAEEIAHVMDVRHGSASQFINPTLPVLITGIWQQPLASVIKLFLLMHHDADTSISLLRAGLGEEPKELLLEDLDRNTPVDHLTTLYVSAMPADSPGSSFYQLSNIISRLRGPNGCPWDREQTHTTLRRHMLEEAYEVLEAIDNNDLFALEEELGDVLLQVSLHSEVADSEGEFDIGDVIRGLTTKLIRRHPHVFGELQAKTAETVVANWQAIKATERSTDKLPASVLDGVPTVLPALARAQSISRRAAGTGFDWSNEREVWNKVNEEMDEVQQASDHRLEEEFGDLIFALVNWARFRYIDAEDAVRVATSKFETRFRHMEQVANSKGIDLKALPAEELDSLWESAKVATTERNYPI